MYKVCVLLISALPVVAFSEATTMDEVLTTARSHYIVQYQEKVETFTKEFQPSAPEVLLLADRGRPRIFQLFRVDLASTAQGHAEIRELNLDSYIDFDAITFSTMESTIKMQPFHWNGIEIEIYPALSSFALIEEWATVWIDEEETAEVDEFGLGKYVHSVTLPINQDNQTYLSIDMGSAPVSAFIELMESIVKSGQFTISVHSNAMIYGASDDA